MAKAKKLPSGSWRVQVYAGEENGKRKYKSFTASTKKEAEYLAAEWARGKKDREQGNITVKEAMSRYIESKENIISPSTCREYLRMVSHFPQELLQARLDSLYQESVQQAINALARGHSAKTVRNMHGLLSSSLAMFAPSLVLRTTLPSKDKEDPYIPTDEDIRRLLECVHGKPIECPILLAATGGLRRGEISALTKEDITDTGVVVSKSMVLSATGREWIVKQPKTAAGFRIVSLPQHVIELARKNVPFPCPNTITDQFIKAIKASGIPRFSFHKLRHYYASSLHALGVPDKYIMASGGWESEQTLNAVYKHAMSATQQRENQRAVEHFTSTLCNTKCNTDSKDSA